MGSANVTKQCGDHIGKGRNGGYAVEEEYGKLLLTIDWRFIYITLNCFPK
jgi:hypothetical protein